ncbi:MAG TPA: ion channel [Streptosporangiaceae bacterium]|nr:ion channel [Streptosporangiaceae bacterium]
METPSQDEQQRHRYGLLLVILLTTYLLSAFLHARWLGAFELAMFTVAGLLALRNTPLRSAVVRLAITTAIALSVVMIVIFFSIDTPTGRGIAGIWTGLLLLLTVGLLLRQVLLLPTVTLQSIFGAISAYLIIGLMFATFYSAINNLQGGFFAGGQPANLSTFQYFSFTTLTTLGYGDFTPVTNGARAVAMIEAMSGQIFLATLVARLVSAFRPSGRAPSLGHPDDD